MYAFGRRLVVKSCVRSFVAHTGSFPCAKSATFVTHSRPLPSDTIASFEDIVTLSLSPIGNSPLPS